MSIHELLEAVRKAKAQKQYNFRALSSFSLGQLGRRQDQTGVMARNELKRRKGLPTKNKTGMYVGIQKDMQKTGASIKRMKNLERALETGNAKKIIKHLRIGAAELKAKRLAKKSQPKNKPKPKSVEQTAAVVDKRPINFHDPKSVGSYDTKSYRVPKKVKAAPAINTAPEVFDRLGSVGKFNTKSVRDTSFQPKSKSHNAPLSFGDGRRPFPNAKKKGVEAVAAQTLRPEPVIVPKPHVVATVPAKVFVGPDGQHYPTATHYVTKGGQIRDWKSFHKYGGYDYDSGNHPEEMPDEKYLQPHQPHAPRARKGFKGFMDKLAVKADQKIQNNARKYAKQGGSYKKWMGQDY